MSTLEDIRAEIKLIREHSDHVPQEVADRLRVAVQEEKDQMTLGSKAAARAAT